VRLGKGVSGVGAVLETIAGRLGRISEALGHGDATGHE